MTLRMMRGGSRIGTKIGTPQLTVFAFQCMRDSYRFECGHSTVEQNMISSIFTNHEIAASIILFILIDMMHLHSKRNRSPEGFLSNKKMS